MDASTTTAPAPPQPPIIRFAGVSMQFGGQRVLNELTLDIERNHRVAVIGESGCGKTVLLKLMIGLLQPTVGEVLFDGRNLFRLNEADLIRERLRFGFLFQGAALFDSLSVYDNVAFGLRNHHRLPEVQIRERVQQRLQEVGLPFSSAEKMPAELSGGMKKRVGLARALALDPEVMLFDEPTTGLDPIMSDVISELILQTGRQRPVTSIVVTHDMKIVQKVAERVVMLEPYSRLEPGAAQVIFDGGTQDLLHSTDPRVHDFVEGAARERLKELARGNA
jgi:phospholipid/cholesterol/gamma-HCH transport system ATP-binding protein